MVITTNRQIKWGIRGNLQECSLAEGEMMTCSDRMWLPVIIKSWTVLILITYTFVFVYFINQKFL